MKWRIRPSKLSGTIVIPPSKSHTIRALLIATLADGVSVIRRPLLSGDGASAIGAARSLGAEIDFQGDILTVKGTGSDFNRGQELPILSKLHLEIFPLQFKVPSRAEAQPSMAYLHNLCRACF